MLDMKILGRVVSVCTTIANRSRDGQMDRRMGGCRDGCTGGLRMPRCLTGFAERQSEPNQKAVSGLQVYSVQLKPNGILWL